LTCLYISSTVSNVQISPKRILGRWRSGFALDHHTISSEYLGDDEFGHPVFDTRRSAVGELLYTLKYRQDASVVDVIADAAAGFVTRWNPRVDALVPVPPSRYRIVQPVPLLAEAISVRLGVPCASSCVSKACDTPQVKDVYDYDERDRMLAGVHIVDPSQVRGRRVLLFDDLYRSGATMNVICGSLYDSGCAEAVFALTVTKSRSKQ